MTHRAFASARVLRPKQGAWGGDLRRHALGVWDGRGTETIGFTASRGDVMQFHVIFNRSDGPVRIHEHERIVVAADRSLRVDVEQVTTDFGACPS